MPRNWGALFPLPLVGAAVLLAVLIFLTPNLISAGSGPAAGSLAAQGELVIDRVVGGTVTHFYVHSVGSVRYNTIQLGLVTNVTWPPPSPGSLAFVNVSTESNSLELVAITSANPVEVNVTAEYTDPSGTAAWYLGVFGIQVTGETLYVEPLLPGSASVSPTPVSDLPLTLFLTASSTEAVS